MDIGKLTDEFKASEEYRQRSTWGVFTRSSSPEAQGHVSAYDVNWDHVLQDRWKDGLVQSALLLCFVIPVVHFVLHRLVFTVRSHARSQLLHRATW